VRSRRPRITYISQFFSPLDVPCVTGFATSLAECGCDVTVVASRIRSEWAADEIMNGLQVRRITMREERLGRLRYLRRMLATVCRGTRPDLIIGNFLDIHGAVAVIAGRLLGVPAVVIEHGSGAHEVRTWPMRDRIFHWIALHFAPLVFALSTDDCEQLKSLAPRTDVALVPCPYSTTGWTEPKTSSKTALGLSDTERHVVVAARLVSVGGKEQKGVSVAIAAMREIPGWHLHVLGDGPLKQDLKRRAEQFGLCPRVSFHGRVPRETVLRYMNAADAVAVPSLYEPFGMVWLEAMEMRTPVVASRVGGPKDYLRDGVDAILIPPGDPAALAAALHSLEEHPALRRSLVQNASERLSDFSPTAVVSRMTAALASRRLWNLNGSGESEGAG